MRKFIEIIDCNQFGIYLHENMCNIKHESPTDEYLEYYISYQTNYNLLSILVSNYVVIISSTLASMLGRNKMLMVI